MKAGGRYWLMIAVLLGATAGLAHLSHGEATPPALPMSEFPTKLGPWAMVIEWPLDKETIDLLGVTDYMNRGYWEPGMEKSLLGLYVGYFRSQRGGASIHSPKNCLPGAGWNPTKSTIYQLQLDDGRTVPVNYYLIRKGLESEVVLYWYQSHGRIVASEYWGKFYMVYDALRLNRTDAALVRITVPVANGDEAAAQERALSFAKQITGNLDKIIPR